MSKQILVMTVGMGVETKRVATLYESMRGSMGTGSWEQVLLLPSSDSHPIARELVEYVRTKHPEPLNIVIGAPLAPGDEDHEDRCFAHFDAALSQVTEDGVAPAEIVFDYTRGTKAMSAAAVLAAVNRGVERIRYITGQRDPVTHQVIGGTERVFDGRTSEALFRRQLSNAKLLLDSGQFAAACQILEPVLAAIPDGDRRRFEVEAGLRLARFWGAWDRFHYSEAASISQTFEEPLPAFWREAAPVRTQLEMISGLSRTISSGPGERAPAEKHKVFAESLAYAHQCLAADVLENGWRRWNRGDWEDTLIRAFRVLELIGQLRLCRHGILASGVCRADSRVQGWEDSLASRKVPWELRHNQIAQPMIADFLRFLKDAFGDDLDRMSTLQFRRRHQSPLTHGFRSQATDPALLAKMLLEVEALFLKENVQNAELLEAACFPMPVITKPR